MGNKYECDKCGKTAWLERKSRCRYGCGGNMSMPSKAFKLPERPCVVCGTVFPPRTERIKCCSDVCSFAHNRAQARERQARRCGTSERAAERPWQWAEFNAENDQRLPVKLVRVLDGGEYPWHDVLSGNMPSMPQWT